MYQKPAKKKLGQHFLEDMYYLNQLMHVICPSKADVFVEIGPGCGYLTELLISRVNHLIAFEIDNDCVSFLQDKYENNKNFELVARDVLQVDFKSILKQYDSPVRWVGNLPYNISVPILLRLVDVFEGIKDGVFLVQKEVSQRLSAQVGQKHYGRLGIVMQCVFEISSVLEIPPSAFNPPPKVDSEVIIIKPLKKTKHHYLKHSKYSEILIRCFSKRRKMLRKIFQDEIDQKQWDLLDIDSSLRPEMISADDFYKISCFLES